MTLTPSGPWLVHVALLSAASFAPSLALGQNTPGPTTRVLIDSAPGDTIGQGRRHEYETPTTPIVATIGRPFSAPKSIEVVIGAEQWYLWLRLPENPTWDTGMYSAAGEQPGIPAHPYKASFRFFGEGRGCGRALRWLKIIEIEVVGDQIQKLALDFFQQCVAGAADESPLAEGPLFGAVRINSAVPLDRDALYANAGADADSATIEGRPIRLDGRQSYARGGDRLQHSWAQVGGPAAVIANPNASFTSIIPPPGAADMEFQLTVSDERGRVDTDTVRVVVRSPHEAQSYLLMDSTLRFYMLYEQVVGQTLEFVGRGRQWLITADNAKFTARRNVHFDGLWAQVSNDAPWELRLATLSREPLVPGSYEDANVYPSVFMGPSLALFGDFRGCNGIYGRFDVLSIVYDGDLVQSAAIDAEQHCEGAWLPLLGRFRYNVVPASLPVARVAGFRFGPHGAGAYRFAPGNANVVLDGSQSSDDGALVSHHWRQVAGPDVGAVGVDTDTIQFTAPAAPPEDRTRLQFRLEVVDDSGNHGFELVTVDVVANTTDADSDGIRDLDDALPSDASEWDDRDGDGVGENHDKFPLKTSEWADSDDDGVGDNSDSLPMDPDEQHDNDQDGIGDNGDPDDDNDGMPDSSELLAVGFMGDGNNDGIMDSKQASVISFMDVSEGRVTVSASSGATLVSAASVPSPNPGATPGGFAFDHGFYAINVDVAPGGTATVIVRYDFDTPDAYWKYDPGTGALYPFLFDGSTGASIEPGHVTLTLVDGGRGDADGLANGHIVDPGAPAWQTSQGGIPTSPGSSRGGGGAPSLALLGVFCLAALARRPVLRQIG